MIKQRISTTYVILKRYQDIFYSLKLIINLMFTITISKIIIIIIFKIMLIDLFKMDLKYLLKTCVNLVIFYFFPGYFKKKLYLCIRYLCPQNIINRGQYKQHK